MTTLEKLDRRIVELIHGLPYEEAIREELKIKGCRLWYEGTMWETGMYGDTIHSSYNLNKTKIRQRILSKNIIGLPNTIGRVMQAYSEAFKKHSALVISVEIICSQETKMRILYFHKKLQCLIDWKLTKENGEECTTADQTEETQEKLLELLK